MELLAFIVLAPFWVTFTAIRLLLRLVRPFAIYLAGLLRRWWYIHHATNGNSGAEQGRSTLGQRLAGASAWKITELAAALAGRTRPALREEWRAHLDGQPGVHFPAWRKLGGRSGLWLQQSVTGSRTWLIWRGFR